jgi:hypothetical protein
MDESEIFSTSELRAARIVKKSTFIKAGPKERLLQHLVRRQGNFPIVANESQVK